MYTPCVAASRESKVCLLWLTGVSVHPWNYIGNKTWMVYRPRLRTGSRISSAKDMNIGLYHAQGAESSDWHADLQSSALPLCLKCAFGCGYWSNDWFSLMMIIFSFGLMVITVITVTTTTITIIITIIIYYYNSIFYLILIFLLYNYYNDHLICLYEYYDDYLYYCYIIPTRLKLHGEVDSGSQRQLTGDLIAWGDVNHVYHTILAAWNSNEFITLT